MTVDCERQGVWEKSRTLEGFFSCLAATIKPFFILKTVSKGSFNKLSQNMNNIHNIPIKVVRNSDQSVESKKFERLTVYVERLSDLTL